MEEDVLVKKGIYKKFYSKGTFLVVFLSFLFVLNVGTTIASPISDDFLIWTRIMENPTGVLVNETTTESSYSQTATSSYDSSIRARGNFVTGSTGTDFSKSSSESQGGQSLIYLYDTISFTTQGNVATSVTAELSLDGFLYNTSTNGYVEGDTSVAIYDITGYDTWLEKLGTETDPSFYNRSGLNKVVDSRISFTVGSEFWINEINTWDPQDESTIDTFGIPQFLDLSKSVIFEVDPSKIYGIAIRSASGLYDPDSLCVDCVADFYSTSVFDFTDLNGATFESGSGVFIISV